MQCYIHDQIADKYNKSKLGGVAPWFKVALDDFWSHPGHRVYDPGLISPSFPGRIITFLY